MRKLVYLLITATVIYGGYFLWTKSEESVLSPASDGSTALAGEETRRFFVSGGDILNQAKNWLFSAPQAVQDKTSGAITDLQTEIRQRASEILLPPPATSSSLPETADSTPGLNPSAPIAGAVGEAAEVDICLSSSKDRSISYIIENPYSPQAGFTYKIDWGDGETYAASVRPQDKSVSASHVYASSGSYVASFEFETASGPATITRKTCVQ